MSVVSVEERGPVSIGSINRPEKLNAINKAVAVELQAAFAGLQGEAQAALSGPLIRGLRWRHDAIICW
jgi:enoyl-CoA hydratase/carnithine racemase